MNKKDEIQVSLFYVALDLEQLNAEQRRTLASFQSEKTGWKSTRELLVFCAMDAESLEPELEQMAQLGVPASAVFCGLEDGLDNVMIRHFEEDQQLVQKTEWLQIRRTQRASWLSKIVGPEQQEMGG